MGVNQKRKWIFFDLDDTLIPSSAIYELCYKKLKLLDDEIFNQARANVKKNIQSGHTSAHNRVLYFKEYLTLKSNFSAKKVLHLSNRYEVLLSSNINNYVKKNNRVNLLKKLAARYRLAIVTNENCRTQMVKIQGLDPRGEIFSKIITSEEVGVAKPNSQIFEHALRITGANAKDVVFVGDDIKNDMEPATQWGMLPVFTREFEDEPKDSRILSKLKVIDHLSQLEAMIDK
jgi:putative hydrolase of the HAD superfamily